MGASREGRRSEQTFHDILVAMRSLTIEVWCPRPEDAQETAEHVKRKLDQMVAEMKAEAFTTPQVPSSNRGSVDTFGLTDTPLRR